MSQQQPNRPNLDDYVPVNERIEAFYAKYPEGSLQTEIVVLTDTQIAMKALAYRTPDDQRPGVGHSSIDVPGRTPYTRGSEMENCETSAWGRAIASLGFEVKRGIASAEEVRNKAGDAPAPRKTAQERPRPQAVPDEPPELSDDDWTGIVDGQEALPLNGNSHLEALSAREFFDRIEADGIDRKDATATAKKMYGAAKWKINDLTDAERAGLYAELTA